MTDGRPIEITLRGHVPSKKNAYTPRRDKPGMFKNSKLQTELDRLAMQIPGYVRDLKLESPAIEFHFTYARANSDRDNAVTTCLDLLVSMGVLADDNTKRCNGLITIHPAVHGDYDGARIILTPKVDQPVASRYVDPRRRRVAIPAIHPATSAPLLPLDDFEDLPESMW